MSRPVLVLLCFALAHPAFAAPQPRSCAPLTGDPAAVYGAGLASAPTREEALRQARQQAIGEIARSICASVEVRGEGAIAVRSRVEGLEGVEEIERWDQADAGRSTACVVLKIARPTIDLRRRADEAVLAAAAEAALGAAKSCPADALDTIARARATLAGLCPSLTTPSGQAVPAVIAALDAARSSGEARLATAARDTAIGVRCTSADGTARACPRGFVEAARAQLVKRGVAASAETLSVDAAAQVLVGTRPPGLCAPALAVLLLIIESETAQKTKRETEHHAVVGGAWVVLAGGQRREGPRVATNAGWYSPQEALAKAAVKLSEAALWP